MTSLHSAIRDHAHPFRLMRKKLSLPIIQEVAQSVDETKSTAQILTDSKNIVTKLKVSLKSDIESLAKSTADMAITKPELQVPPAPKSPRMKLPTSIPEPTKSDFAIPISPRK